MSKLKPGDCIVCRLKENCVVNPYNSDYDDTKSFDIISSDGSGYYLYIPPYISVKGSIKADSFLLKQIKVDKKYLGDTILYIREGLIYKIKSVVDGNVCEHCGDFCYQAAPNQENGGFLCWSCRDNPYR